MRLLVTGASSGIGRSLARAAAGAGCRVAAIARSEPALESLADEVSRFGGVLLPIAADITVEEDRRKARELVLEHFGGLDVLVNNAGIGATGPYLELGSETLRAVMETNLFAPAEMMRLFLPDLQLGRTPLIVNVSSVLGRKGFPTQSMYCASKFALQGLSDAIRAELCKTPVRILVVNPGMTRTDFTQHQVDHVGRMPYDLREGMPPDTVAEAILRAIARGQDELTLTAQGRLLVLASRFAPRLAEWVIRRKVARSLQAQANG